MDIYTYRERERGGLPCCVLGRGIVEKKPWLPRSPCRRLAHQPWPPLAAARRLVSGALGV